MTLRPILLGLAALCATPALAQAVSALKGHNSNAPVDVEADRIEVQDRADRAVFSGSVRVKQGDLNLNAARLTVAYAGQASAGGVDIKRLDASGGVTVRSPTETAQGQFAVYDLDRRLITMLGGVTLDRQGNQVKGQRLVLDLNTGRATVDGGVVGGGGAGGAVSGASGGGRVTGHFTVRQNTQSQ